ncbi:H-2 class I histocompatibility antigen, Q9 alpha chain-like isoform X2 [Oncorhynchus tshawytscha]|uniref:H-2 class I histocompatibility antigen, Q9 alpha chain-like isoform X2 n=1 Tax=Oncorhynchus tshawytscha TaxID=74940 RepID=UPI001C3CDD34|nr:H-2 class I histocompatibility antigen, Q9 alpha chain-like isoform X2 [Oncorhynchus tshawytscha]
MKGFILLVLGIGLLHCASAATHSLRYVYTAISGIPNFPEFVNLGIVDGMQIDYYDSNTKRVVPKQDWMAKTEGSDYWETETQVSIGAEQTFKAGIENIKPRFNQTGGVHVLQRMYGCELDDDGITRGYFQFGYDGADFLSLDKSTRTWTAANQKAVITKLKWDATGDNANYWKNYLENTCIEWLKKYVNYGKDTLERKVPPSVSLLQKTPSSPVTCHATGFYPSGVTVFWQKDGQEQHEDVLHGEILPNGDGTFQKSTQLKVTPEEWKNNKYQCVVQVTGIMVDFIKVLAESENQPDWRRGVNTIGSAPIIGVAVALLIVVAVVAVVAVVVGVVMWRKKKKSEKASDADSDNSGKGLQKT